jgi:hypothetical protein
LRTLPRDRLRQRMRNRFLGMVPKAVPWVGMERPLRGWGAEESRGRANKIDKGY